MKRPVLISVIVLSFVLGAVLGAVLSFNYSIKFCSAFKEDAVHTRASANANIALRTLYNLRDNKVKDAIALQEIILDGELITFMHYNTVAQDMRDDNVIRVINSARKYRSKYPRKTGYPEIDEAVEKVLSSDIISQGNP
jgi:hypothetical protein